MSKLRRVSVFCGSALGAKEEYSEVARQLGLALAAANISLVYGGAKVGLMGVIADAMLKVGGEVIGVMPKLLVEKEIAHPGITQLHIVNSMHERKALMADFSDGFIMLPGGVGTLDEFFEIVTWRQLGIHKKPCGILNAHNYYDHLIRFLDLTVTENFLMPVYREKIIIENTPQKLLDAFNHYQAPTVIKWENVPIPS